MNWGDRYASDDTPWDLGRVHPELEFRLRGDLRALGEDPRALVPGCGRGHDAAALGAAGWKVTAIDAVEELRQAVESRLEPAGGEFVVGDALSHEGGPFDLLWDHTFFCAIDPAERHRYGDMARRLVRSGGKVALLVYPVGRPYEHGGPPWAMSADQVADVLRAEFDLVQDEPVKHPGHKSWPERWALFVRK